MLIPFVLKIIRLNLCIVVICGYSFWKSHAPYQLVKARVVAQGIKTRIDFDIQKQVLAVVQGFIQFREGFVLLTQLHQERCGDER